MATKGVAPGEECYPDACKEVIKGDLNCILGVVCADEKLSFLFYTLLLGQYPEDCEGFSLIVQIRIDKVLLKLAKLHADIAVDLLKKEPFYKGNMYAVHKIGLAWPHQCGDKALKLLCTHCWLLEDRANGYGSLDMLGSVRSILVYIDEIRAAQRKAGDC